MKKTIQIFAIILPLILMLAFSGCGSKSGKDKILFSCKSNNFMGLKEIAVSDDGQMTIRLDKKYAAKGDYPYGLFEDFFREGKYPEDREITFFYTDGTTTGIPAEEIKVDGSKGTISFSAEDIELDNIESIWVYHSKYYHCEIRVIACEIETEEYGGECTMITSQKYSPESDSWSEIDIKTILYPMTEG